jgi:hypothetical protein
MAYKEPTVRSKTPGVTPEERRADASRVERFLALLPREEVRAAVQRSLCALWGDDYQAAVGSPASLLREMAQSGEFSQEESERFRVAAIEAERMPRRNFVPPSALVDDEVATVQSEVMRGLLNGLLLAWSLAYPAHEGRKGGTIDVGAFDLAPRDDAGSWRPRWAQTMGEVDEQLLSALPLSEESLAAIQKTGAAKVAARAREHVVELPQGLLLTAKGGDWLLLSCG